MPSYGCPPYKRGAAHLGGSLRWRTHWTTTTHLSQRAESSPLWSGPCLESLMGRGLARIPRVGCDTRGGSAPGVSARRPVRRAGRGWKWRERPHAFWRWCATGQGEVARMKIRTISPLRWGLPTICQEVESRFVWPSVTGIHPFRKPGEPIRDSRPPHRPQEAGCALERRLRQRQP